MDMVKDGRTRTFTTIEDVIIDTADLNVLEKMAYLVLSRFANCDSGIAGQSLENIAVRMGGVRLSQVNAALEGLVKKEYIEIESSSDGEENATAIYYMLDLPDSVAQFGDIGVGGI